ncbi:hypothetical protein BHE74_00050012, partial [Ensete ventricosum]
GDHNATSEVHTDGDSRVDYICFKVPDESLELTNCIGIIRGFANGLDPVQKRVTSPEAILLCIPDAFQCVDLSLYKENQIVLLLNEATSTLKSTMRSLIMMVQISDYCFLPLSQGTPANLWTLQILKASAVEMHLEIGKVRYISEPVTSPLAVSASRGLACIFTSRKHAMVYILDEDEDETSDID